MDDRWFGSTFQIPEATDEIDLEVAMVVLRGEQIMRKMKSGVLEPVHIVGWEMQNKMAAQIGALWK